MLPIANPQTQEYEWRMAMRAITGFFVAGLLLAGCARKNVDLVPLGKRIDAFVNVHNFGGFARLPCRFTGMATVR